MDRLSSDPRTASMEVGWGFRTQMNSLADRLFAELGPGEQAKWAAVSMSLVSQVAVMTDRRLLVLPVAPHKPTQIVGLPFEVILGKKKMMGQALEVPSTQGARVSLVLQPDDLARLQRDKATSPGPAPAEPIPPGTWGPAPAPSHAGTASASAAPSWDAPGAGGPPQAPGANAPSGWVRGGPGGWNWGRPVHTFRDAEFLAGAHMSYLGYPRVMVTQASVDQGLDVVAQGAAAQVKYQQAPTGGPDVQRLRGAADGFADRLFYATGYTPAAHTAAQQLGIALFEFTVHGLVVAVNTTARTVPARGATAPPERGFFGALTFEARQNRAVGWSHQISDAAATPISNRVRKGAKQMEKRAQALQLMTEGLALLQDSDNSLYKKARKERTLVQAEKALKSAGFMLGLYLK